MSPAAFLAARRLRCSVTSNSDFPEGILKDFGAWERLISANNSSMDETPIVFNISWTSVGVLAMNEATGDHLDLADAFQKFLIFFGGHEVGGLFLVRNLDFGDPPFFKSGFVDKAGIGFQAGVDFSDFAGDRRENIVGRFDGLDGGEFFKLLDLGPDTGKFHEGDVP